MKRIVALILVAASVMFSAVSCLVDNVEDVTIDVTNSYTNGVDALSAFSKASVIFNEEIRKAADPDILGSMMVIRNQRSLNNAVSKVKLGAANAEARVLAGQTGYDLSKTSSSEEHVFGVQVSLSGFGGKVVYEQRFLIEDHE